MLHLSWCEDNVAHIQKKLLNTLSDLERQVLSAFLEGKSYQEIAKMLNRRVKSIDNALQRVKKKVVLYLEEKRKEEL